MKPRVHSTARLAFPLASAISALLATTSLRAAVLIWDNGAATGNWNTTDLNWTGSAWNNATPDDAIFAATGVGAVALSEAITAGSLTINTAGYTINTGTFGLTLNSAITANESATVSGAAGLILGGNNAWSVADTKTLTVSSAISGAFGITKSGTGTLGLSGANSFSGQLTVENGTLSIGTANNISASGTLGNSALPVILGKSGGQTGILSYTGATVTSTKPLTMASGGTGNISVTTSGNNLTLSGVIDGSGSLSKSGAGILTLSNTANTYSGSTVISGGRLVASAALASLGTGSADIVFNASAQLQPFSGSSTRGITINNSALAQLGGNGSYTFTGNVTGNGGICASAFNFGSNVFLNGTANTFEGQIVIGQSSGTGNQAFGVTVNSLADSATANGRILFNSQTSHSSGSVFGYAGATPLVIANRQLELASATTNPTSGHQIRANGSVGTATLTINTNLIVSTGVPQTLALRGSNTGENTFAGIISNSTVVGTTPLSVAYAAAATTITLASVQGITVGATISGTGIAGGTTITAIDPSTKVVTLSAATSGAGTVGQIMTVPGVLNPTSITKNTDAGTWTLSGNNTHSGGTTFSTGKLNINHAGALGTGTLTIGAGTFDNTSGVAITNANNNAIAWNGDATFTGTNSLDLGTGAVTMGGNRSIVVSGSALTMGGPVSGAFGITLGGNGIFVLNGANTYTGKTTIGNNAGSSLRLRVNSIANLGAAPSALGNPTTTANGLIQIGATSNSSTLEFTGMSGNQSTDRQVQVGSSANGSGGATIANNDPTSTVTFSNVAFNVAATGITSTNRTLTLSGSNTGNNTISGVIINNVGTAPFGLISLAKSGTGTWVLAGANTYSGGTSISAGTLVLANTSAVQGSSALTIGGASAATLRLATDTAFTVLPQIGGASGAGGTTFVSDRATTGAGLTHALGSPNLGANTFNFTSGGNVASGTAGFTLAAVGMTSGTAGTTVLNPTTAALTIVGGVTSQTNDVARTLELGGTGTGYSIGGVITQTVASPLSLTKSNTSTWTLAGANTYSGTTTVSGGTLALGGNNILPDTSNVTIGAATLDAATFADTAGTLAVTGAAAINLGSGAALAFADSNAITWTGTLNITGTLGATSLRFGTSGSGLTSGQLALISVNGSGLGTYTLDTNGYLVSGGGGAPEIAVNQGGDIASGGSKDFGTVTTGSNTSLVFTISNSGTAALNLSGSPLVAVSGANAADFTVTALPTTPVTSGGGTTTFTVQFAPSAAGVRNAVLTIANNDSDEGTFTINVSGTGQTPYDAWAGGAAFDADANGDGVKNGVAFLLGASGPNTAVTLPVVSQSSGNLILTFNMLNAVSRGSATLSVEHSSNLGISDPWTPVLVTDSNSGPTSGVTFAVTPGSPTNSVTATISSSEAASGKLFGRLNGQQ